MGFYLYQELRALPSYFPCHWCAK